MSEEFNNIIVLTDENGEDAEFEFLDLIEYNGKEYVVLMPAEDDSGEVVILEVSPLNDEEESYLAVEDENTLTAVFEIFKERFSSEFDFVD